MTPRGGVARSVRGRQPAPTRRGRLSSLAAAGEPPRPAGQRACPAQALRSILGQVLYHGVLPRLPLLLLLTLSAFVSLRPSACPSVCTPACLCACVYVCTQPVAQSLLYQPLAAVQFYVSYYTILFRRSQSGPARPALVLRLAWPGHCRTLPDHSRTALL